MSSNLCPICGGDVQIRSTLKHMDNNAVECNACGTYIIINDNLDIDKDKFASYLFYHKAKYNWCNCFIGNEAQYQVQKVLHPNIKYLDKDEIYNWYPSSFQKKIDLIMLLFGEIDPYGGGFRIHLNEGEKLSMFFIKRRTNDGKVSPSIERNTQYQNRIDYLEKERLVKVNLNEFIVQPNGYKYIAKLKEEKENNCELFDEEIKSMQQAITLKSRVDEFIVRGEVIKLKEYHEPQRGVAIQPHVSGPLFDAWMNEIEIFNDRHLKSHPLFKSIHSTYFHRKTSLSSCEDMLGHLRALAADSDYWDSVEPAPIKTRNAIKGECESKMNNKVFIVHGHDNAAKIEMARTLEKAGFDAIILHEKANSSKTIIEKIEAYTDVCFAVVLYTPCDIGRAKEETKENARARQNVVFEHGYLIGKLGRERVCALVKGDIEIPSDITGVIYIPMDNAGAWKMDLAKEMQSVGIQFDLNKLLS